MGTGRARGAAANPHPERKVVQTMYRMHRAVGILPVLALVAAACAPAGMGGGTTNETGASQGDTSAIPAPSAPPGSDAVDVPRVDIGVLAAEPAALEGQPVAVLARVDEVLVDGRAFLTSPSASEEGQFPVVVSGDATVGKEIATGAVVWLEGSVIALTAEDLEAAGVEVAVEELGGLDGEFVFVADTVADPLEHM